MEIKSTEQRLSRAWYVKYQCDAYALGPFRYQEMVPATVAIEQSEKQFGCKPYEVWPSGKTEQVEEYEIELETV